MSKLPTHKTKRKKKQPQKTVEPLAVLERKLRGHTDWVSMAISPNGKWMASGSEDRSLKVWDLVTGECLITKRHTGKITCVEFLSDSRLLFGDQNGNVSLLEELNGTILEARQFPDKNIWKLVPMTDGKRIISGGGRGTHVELWDLSQVDDLWHRELHINSLAVLEEQSLVICGLNKEITFISLSSGETLAELTGHTDVVWSLAVTPNADVAISGSSDSTLKIWDLQTHACLGTLEGHEGSVFSVAISPAGAMLASGGNDNTIRLWDWKSGTCMQVLRHPRAGSVSSLVFSPDGSKLVAGFRMGEIYVYQLTGVDFVHPVEATRRYVNAKVVLIGEGTVGKTSLAHRLVEDKYVVHDRTHGMNVWQLDLPLPPDTTIEREALLWDLAGQEDYRLIHQLFLDETALALLLINPQKNDPFAEAGDWLKALKAACGQRETAGETAQLLIFSQTDVGGMKLGKAKIERFCEQYGFSEWLATSAKSGENCSDKQNRNQPSKLKQLIASSIPWDKLPWTSTPRLLNELKKALVAIRDERDIRLLRFAELTQRLEQALPDEKFEESDVRTAVTLLANHGLARPLKFGDLVLLQPELLNGYAGAIIRAARANKDEIGSVLENDIYRPDFDFTGVERLKRRSDEELLLHALVQTFLDHSLCIAEDLANGRHLVFPSQYRREKDIPHDPDIFVSYTFSGEWQTVWTTLVVRLWYSQEFDHKELWRNAAEFASPKGFTLGLKIDKLGEGTATVSLYFDKEVPDELKAIFIEYVHRHLAKYGCEVSRDRRYICSECGKAVTDLAEVRKRLEAKKEFIYCQGCDEKVPLIDFIEQRLKSDPVARKILAMDETATRKLDTHALEQILIGHMMATCGEANQIFRPTTMFDYGIDGEVEFKDDNGKASGKRIYIQLKSGNSYLRTRKSDGREVFNIKNERHLDYWTSQPVDVYLVIRQTDDALGSQTIRWMNVTRYLKDRKDKKSRQIIFTGEKLDMEAVWKVRDQFFPAKTQRQK